VIVVKTIQNKSASTFVPRITVRRWPHAATLWYGRQISTNGRYDHDRYLPPAPELLQTSCRRRCRSTGQTDRRTDIRPLHIRLLPTMRPASINEHKVAVTKSAKDTKRNLILTPSFTVITGNNYIFHNS